MIVAIAPMGETMFPPCCPLLLAVPSRDALRLSPGGARLRRQLTALDRMDLEVGS
jgi:hypothetical protein